MTTRIYAGRREAYFDGKLRTVDSFQVVLEDGFRVNVHVSPSDDDYWIVARNVAGLIGSQKREIDSPLITTNGSLYSENGLARQINLEGEKFNILNVPKGKFMEFQLGFLEELKEIKNGSR